MFKLSIDKKRSISKLIIEESISGEDLRKVINIVGTNTSQFVNGYKAWIILPDNLGELPLDSAIKIDVNAARSKLKGLRFLVVQIPKNSTSSLKTAEGIIKIYVGLGIFCTITRSSIESIRTFNRLTL